MIWIHLYWTWDETVASAEEALFLQSVRPTGWVNLDWHNLNAFLVVTLAIQRAGGAGGGPTTEWRNRRRPSSPGMRRTLVRIGFLVTRPLHSLLPYFQWIVLACPQTITACVWHWMRPVCGGSRGWVPVVSGQRNGSFCFYEEDWLFFHFRLVAWMKMMTRIPFGQFSCIYISWGQFSWRTVFDNAENGQRIAKCLEKSEKDLFKHISVGSYNQVSTYLMLKRTQIRPHLPYFLEPPDFNLPDKHVHPISSGSIILAFATSTATAAAASATTTTAPSAQLRKVCGYNRVRQLIPPQDPPWLSVVEPLKDGAGIFALGQNFVQDSWKVFLNFEFMCCFIFLHPVVKTDCWFCGYM